jgi:GNAT superfamily N-acetyltransferase
LTARADETRTRRAGGAELADVTALWLALTRHHEALDPAFALRPGAEAEVRRLLEAHLGDPATAIFLADDAAPPDGFAIAHLSRAPPIHPETCRAEITDLFVAPAARRRGLGRALVAAATRWAKGRGAERLEARVVAGNDLGQAFWRSVGFASCVDVLQRRV